MSYIISPNLPQSKVSHVLCQSDEKICAALAQQGVQVIDAGLSVALPSLTARHADLLCRHLGGNKVALAAQNSALVELGFEIIKINIKPDYPNYCCLNFAQIGDYIIGNKHVLPPELQNEKELIHVKQAYAKCNICIVDEESFVTSDVGIFNACKHYFDVLLIKHGAIELRGYDYGFIGGASGKLDKNLLAFCGDISLHPSYKEISAFLEQKQINFISLLQDEKLKDIGSIIPLIEK